MKIQVYTKFNERHKIRYSTTFEVVDELPKVGDLLEDNKYYRNVVINVREVSIDCEQGNDEVYNYSYYYVRVKSQEFDEDLNKWIDTNEYTENYAIKEEYEEEKE